MLDRIKSATRWNQKDSWHRLAASFFDPENTVLDLGCGHGDFLNHAPQSAIGLDWSAANLHIAAQSGREVIEGDARALPFDDATMDGAHCSHMLEHLAAEDVHKVLGQIDRVLKPGGILVLRGPMMWSGFWDDLTHIRPYPPGVIMKYLCGSSDPRTMPVISASYKVLHRRWRYAPLRLHIPYVDVVLHRLNRWGFPWLKRTGYMLVLRKSEDSETSVPEQ